MTVLDTLPDRVAAQMRPLRADRAALTFLAAVLYVLGWAPAKLARAVRLLLAIGGFAAGWCVAAVRLGWREGTRAAGDG